MGIDDPAARAILRCAMVARLATLSGSGRPSVTPLYFVCRAGHVWLGTPVWTLAVRDVKADPRVSLLFNVEGAPGDGRLLRLAGRATVRTDAEAQRSYVWRVALKYSLSPGGLWSQLAHLRLLPLQRRYRAQSAARGPGAVIDVTPEGVELLGAWVVRGIGGSSGQN